MKRILIALAAGFTLAIAPIAAHAEDVIIDKLSEAEAEELDIDIPDDVPPGFHQVEIEVLDDNGVVNTKIVNFCKTNEGEVRWDLSCAKDEVLEPFNPTKNVEETADTMVDGFALAAAATAAAAGAAAGAAASGAATAARRRQEDEEEEKDTDQGEVGSAEFGKLHKATKDAGIGDLSRTWQLLPLVGLEGRLHIWTEKVSRFSPVLARSLADGSYLRAIFGTLSFIPYAIAPILGLIAAFNTGGDAVTPATGIVIAMIALGVVDALAGFIAAFIFTLGMLVSGSLNGHDHILFALGFMVLIFAPPLLASNFRPLRRHQESEDWLRDRITDFALATLMTGWAVIGLVKALNGLADVEMPLSADARTVGLWAALFVFTRFAAEEVAVRYYPQRLEISTPQLDDPSDRQKAISLTIKTVLFFVVAEPVVGLNIQLMLATVIFVLPNVLNLTVGDMLPSLKNLGWLVPKGALKTFVMIFVGAQFAVLINWLIDDPSTVLKWGVVLFAIPGLALSLMAQVAEPVKPQWHRLPQGPWVRFALGGLIYAFLLNQAFFS